MRRQKQPKRKKATTSAEKQNLLDRVRYWVLYCHEGWTIYSWDVQALSRRWKCKEGEIEHCFSLLNKEGLMSGKRTPMFAQDRRPSEWDKYIKCEKVSGRKYRY